MRISDAPKADFFGTVRYINLFKANKAAPNEIFFSITRKNRRDGAFKKAEFGYMVKTPDMEQFIKNFFFTGCTGIEFIEWNSCWNVVFPEKSIIGDTSFTIPFEEFDEIFKDTNVTEKASA